MIARGLDASDSSGACQPFKIEVRCEDPHPCLADIVREVGESSELRLDQGFAVRAARAGRIGELNGVVLPPADVANVSSDKVRLGAGIGTRFGSFDENRLT